jgi:hypothetical protein
MSLDEPWSGDHTELREIAGELYKWCDRGSHWVLVTHFGNDRRMPGGKYVVCNTCEKRGNEVRKAHEHLRIPMMEAQDYKCPICTNPIGPGGRQAVMDHCHKTNAVRGMLCSKCNIALGIFKDNITALRNAVAYLEKGGGGIM